jgi:Asp-tRNA(Asn)/Glu-tRNA(Gln) amidotransferase A subunit family amidase
MIVDESLTRIAELIRSRSVSPVEVAEAHLERISKVNPQLNAIVTLAPDFLDNARSAEAAVARRDELGVLHGVPVTIKDTIEIAGLRSTSGSKIRADFVPDVDAPCVTRLKKAGAIILGKTNVAEMAMDYTADNLVFGRTNHPLDASLTPGGSSGGEAVAIATGMSPGGLGSDLAGSIRVPAHFCGVAGLKPTTNRIPGEGQCPPSSGPYSLGAVIGPLARTIGDLRLLFRAVSKVQPGESERRDALKNVRVAWYADDTIAAVTDETAKAVATSASALSEAGLMVEELRPPHVERANELWLSVFSRASVVQLRKLYAGREGDGGSFVTWRLSTADDSPTATLDEYILSWMERDRLRSELIQWMEKYPILLCPVGATPAYKHDTLKVTVKGQSMGTFRAFSYAQAFSLFDLPVVTLPVGKSEEGLPIGVQVVGRPYEEEMVMRVAEIIEREIRT